MDSRNSRNSIKTRILPLLLVGVGLPLLLLFASRLLHAQTPGTVVVASTITATVGTGSTQLVCVLSNTASQLSVQSVCSTGGVVVSTVTATPGVGSSANGFVGSYTLGGNTITWTFTQPTAGNIAWTLSANGTLRSGTL